MYIPRLQQGQFRDTYKYISCLGNKTAVSGQQAKEIQGQRTSQLCQQKEVCLLAMALKGQKGQL